MIDVHVLTHSGTKQAWLDQCLESLEREKACTVRVLQGVEGHVGVGRANGFQLGSHEFVAFVDSDDYVLPGVIDACLRGLALHRSVVTLEQVEVDGVIMPTPMGGHHMDAYRRADVLAFLPRFMQTANRGEKAMRQALKPTQLDFVGYVWRCYAGGFHHTAGETPDWSQEAFE